MDMFFVCSPYFCAVISKYMIDIDMDISVCWWGGYIKRTNQATNKP